MHRDDENPASAKEPAEGSRENAGDRANQEGTISNRPRDEERTDEVPPRGERKE